MAINIDNRYSTRGDLVRGPRSARKVRAAAGAQERKEKPKEDGTRETRSLTLSKPEAALCFVLKTLRSKERFQPHWPTVNDEFVTSFAKAIMLLLHLHPLLFGVAIANPLMPFRSLSLPPPLSLTLSPHLCFFIHYSVLWPRTVGFYIFLSPLTRKIALTFKSKDLTAPLEMLYSHCG